MPSMELAKQPTESTVLTMKHPSWQTEYPFCSHRIQIDGHDYHYVDQGNGSPVLMVHGNPTWSFYWRHLISGLQSTHRAIAPDHIGCGLSDKPQDYEYSLPQHISNLVRLIDELDLNNITLLGHDWGGAIGLGAALQRSNRFSRFVLFNTGAFPPPFFPWRIRVCRTPFLGKLALQGMNLFSLAALAMAVARPADLSDTFKDGILLPYDSWENRIAVYRFVKDIPQSSAHPTWKVLKEIEAGLAVFSQHPVSLIWGMKDWCFRPECLDRFIEIFPQAEVHRLKDVGHWVVEEAKDDVMRLVSEFVQSDHPVSQKAGLR